jgi:hypothetical protein
LAATIAAYSRLTQHSEGDQQVQTSGASTTNAQICSVHCGLLHKKKAPRVGRFKGGFIDHYAQAATSITSSQSVLKSPA